MGKGRLKFLRSCQALVDGANGTQDDANRKKWIDWGTAGVGGAVFLTGVILRLLADDPDDFRVARAGHVQPFAWTSADGGGFGVRGSSWRGPREEVWPPDTFMVILMVMLKVNVAEAKAKLSQYLTSVAEGETVVICNRNVPVAELRAIPQAAKKPRPVGLAKGKFRVPPRFFEPLPDDIVAAFHGGL
jgi:antitoxin (DNA-binding transcriptional repressor) of toxin-antitoxin stability system